MFSLVRSVVLQGGALCSKDFLLEVIKEKGVVVRKDQFRDTTEPADFNSKA